LLLAPDEDMVDAENEPRYLTQPDAAAACSIPVQQER